MVKNSSHCLSVPPLGARGGGIVGRACVNSASDCYMVLGGRKDLGEETDIYVGWWCAHVRNGSSLHQLCWGGKVLQGWRWWLVLLAAWPRKASLAPSALPRQHRLPLDFPHPGKQISPLGVAVMAWFLPRLWM